MTVVPGHPDYAVTETGDVWSYRHKIFLKARRAYNGYLRVAFWNSGSGVGYSVHRLVLETFVGPCPEGMECRHLNGDPTDNRLENLCWGTRTENMQDRIKHGGVFGVKGEEHYKAKLTEQEVRMIRHSYRTGGFAQWEIAKLYRIDQSSVSNIVNKKTWKHI